MSQYSSPTMLIARKNFGMKRIITDFRVLVSRLQTVKLAFQMIKDTFSILESCKCECLSVISETSISYTKIIRKLQTIL